MANRPVAGKRITRAEWVSRAVRLAIKGWSTRRIGAAVGRSHTDVRRALDREFERVRPTGEELEAIRGLHREKLLRREERLNRLTQAHWARATSGDIDASKAVIDADKGLDRVHASLAKLDGLDAPTKSEVTGKDGAPLGPEPSVAEAARLVREAFGSHAMKEEADAAGDTTAKGSTSVPKRPPDE